MIRFASLIAEIFFRVDQYFLTPHTTEGENNSEDVRLQNEIGWSERVVGEKISVGEKTSCKIHSIHRDERECMTQHVYVKKSVCV